MVQGPAGVQEIVVGAAPNKFFVPPYVGHKGWIGVRLDGEVDWNEVAEFMTDAHEMTAPKPRRGRDPGPRTAAKKRRTPAGVEGSNTGRAPQHQALLSRGFGTRSAPPARQCIAPGGRVVYVSLAVDWDQHLFD